MTKQQYGLHLHGVVRVFRKDKDIEDKAKKVKFTVSDVWFNVSEKEEDGTWFNVSTNLIFKRGEAVPENNTVIHILSARPMITGKGKYRRLVYFVEAWENVQ